MIVNDKEALAAFLVRQIFACGDTEHDRTQRLAMKGGTYGQHETDLGGFNENALVAHLTRALLEFDRSQGGLDREAVPVECISCGHAWIGLYTPMPIADAARVMKNLMCPMCAAGSSKIKPTSTSEAP